MITKGQLRQYLARITAAGVPDSAPIYYCYQGMTEHKHLPIDHIDTERLEKVPHAMINKVILIVRG